MRPRVSFPALPQFQMWIRSGTGSNQPREDNWIATSLKVADLIKKVDIIRLNGA